MCDEEELEILIGKEGFFVLKDLIEFGYLLYKFVILGMCFLKKFFGYYWLNINCEINLESLYMFRFGKMYCNYNYSIW